VQTPAAELEGVRVELVARLPDLRGSGAFGVGISEAKNRVVVLSTNDESTRRALASLYPGRYPDSLVDVEQAEMPTTDFSG
jgi:hypothetical protein